MIRKGLSLAAVAFLGFVAMLMLVAFQPTTMPSSQGASALGVLAAYNSKEGQGDVLCGPAGPSGPGAQVAAQAAQAAGFAGDDLVIAVAVAGAESNWNPTATNRNTNGSTDYGLWQINSVHATILASGDWRDPYSNARMAKRVHDDAGGWTPWVTYNTGAHQRFITAAKGAVAGAPAVSAQPCAGGAGGPQGGDDRLTPWTRAMRDDLARQFPGHVIGCYRAAEDGGEHPRGRACDVMVPVDSATGDTIAGYVQQHSARLHIMYVIWRQHIWSPGRAREGWRPMEDRGSVTQNHRDHVHVSVLP